MWSIAELSKYCAFIFTALVVLSACSCVKEAVTVVPDYRERGSKSLLLRPYRETVAEVESKIGNRCDLLSNDRAWARRTLEELIWLHYDEPDFFIFLSGSGNNEVVEESIDHLRRFLNNGSVRDALCRLTSADSDRVRDEALFYLSQVKDVEFRQKTLTSYVIKGAEDSSEAVRCRAVTAMKGFERGEAGKVLEYTSDDKAPSVRGESLRVRAFLGDEAAIPQIRKGLQDSSPFVRVCALEACAILMMKDAVPQIASSLDDRQCSFYAVPYDDGTMCSFNTREATVQEAAQKALEVIYSRRFNNVDACRLWCRKYISVSDKNLTCREEVIE